MAEAEVLRCLPLREHLVDHTTPLLYTVADLVYAYCYNHRVTLGEDNVESAWTITKISATLSWLQVPQPIRLDSTVLDVRCL